MCYFYGLKPKEVFDLDVETNWILWESITVIEAQEMLKNITTSSYSEYSKSDQKKIHRSLHRQAYPENFRERVEVTTENLAKFLGG